MPVDKPMQIWNEVCEVDKAFTKPIKDGRNLTSIIPMYLIRQATKLWGPIGEGWGFEIIKDDCIYMNSRERPQDALHIMTIKLWYGTGKLTYGMGCTKLFQRRGDDWYIDDDFNKSTLTDAITNALSRLGFGGSIRLGEYQGKYDVVADEDTELRKAWEEYIKYWRKKKGYGPDDPSDEEIIQSAVDFLQENSRRVTPETIRAMIK